MAEAKVGGRNLFLLNGIFPASATEGRPISGPRAGATGRMLDIPWSGH